MNERTPSSQLANAAHRHYQAWATGDGAKTEFALPKTVQRVEQLMVTSEGKVLRPDQDGTTTFDYAVRGITPGYAGDATMVKFHVAPPVNANVGFFLNTD